MEDERTDGPLVLSALRAPRPGNGRRGLKNGTCLHYIITHGAWHLELVLEYYCWYTANTFSRSVFSALSIAILFNQVYKNRSYQTIRFMLKV